MHLQVARGPVADRAQDACLTCRPARRVVGEDVVELVAPAALQATDVGSLAVAVLDLGLGLDLPLRDRVRIGVVLLGEAEVDECAVPCVAESHRCRFFRAAGEKPLSDKLPG
jgi:hypothetical protein